VLPKVWGSVEINVGECSDHDLGGYGITNTHPKPVTREEYEKKQREA